MYKERPVQVWRDRPARHGWARSWAFKTIAITNIVWHILQLRMVGGKHCIAQ